MNHAVRRLPERNDPGIETVDQRTERNEVQRAFRTDIQTVLHSALLSPAKNAVVAASLTLHPFFHTVEVTLPPWPVQFV